MTVYNLLRNSFNAWNKFGFLQVKLTKKSYIGIFFKVSFIQDFCLFWVLFQRGFSVFDINIRNKCPIVANKQCMIK
jgi:hypothetical protein